MPNRLKILMKIFAIKNKDLSQYLQVDVSLVSKWRSGARNIASNKEYLCKLISYVLNLDRRNNFSQVRELLSGEYVLSERWTEDELALLLNDWLCASGAVKTNSLAMSDILQGGTWSKIERLYLWKGRDGRREAIKYFNEYARQCSSEIEIYSYMSDSNQWFHEDRAFLDLYTKMANDLFQKGNTLNIIYSVNRLCHETAASLAYWIPLHLCDNVEGYFVPRFNEDESLKIMFLLLKGKALVFGISSGENDACYSWLVFDSAFLKRMEGIAMQYFKSAVPIFKKYILNRDPGDQTFWGDFAASIEKNTDAYLVNEFDQFLPVHRETRKKFFEQLGLNKQKTKELIERLEKLDDLKNTCECFYLIDLELLDWYSQQESAPNSFLSLLAGEKITVENSLIRKNILEFMEAASSNERIHLGIIGGKYQEELGKLGICCERRGIRAIIHTYGLDEVCALGISEYAIALSLSREMEDVWRAIPAILKDKEYVIEEITRKMQNG